MASVSCIMRKAKRCFGSECVPMILIFLVAIIFVVVIMSMPQPIGDINRLPINNLLEYKSVENTGLLGVAQYYIFDIDGNRYMVTQKLFDSFIDLPKR